VLGIDYLLAEACIQDFISQEEFQAKILDYDKFHKLNLLRVQELIKLVNMMKQTQKKEKV
jgi:hypothetical protein